MKQERIILPALMIILTIFSYTTAFAQKQPVTQIDIIFDASGSMWGQIDGKTKIETAKDAVYKIIDDIEKTNNLQVALRVYGHLNKKCSNSVLETKMGSINKKALKEKIRSIKPKGKTPISYSLIRAANDFKKEINGKKVIILITDGIESCNADPCKASLKLKNAGIVTKIHVVGFGLKTKELNNLKCIVRPSQGLVLGAQNARDLSKALGKIVNETISINLEIKAQNSKGRDIFSDYEIYKSNAPSKKIIAKGDNSLGQKASLFLESGKYDIKVINNGTGDEIWFRNTIIDENKKTIKTAIFAQRKVKIKIKNKNGKYLYGDVYIYDKDGKQVKFADTSMGNQANFELLPGIYDIKVFEYETRKEAWQKDVDLIQATEFISEIVVD